MPQLLNPQLRCTARRGAQADRREAYLDPVEAPVQLASCAAQRIVGIGLDAPPLRFDGSPRTGDLVHTSPDGIAAVG